MKTFSRFLELAGLAYLNSLLLSVLFFTLSQDQLLFKTDTLNLMRFFAATGFIAFAVLMLLLALIAIVSRPPALPGLLKGLRALAFCFILFGFIILIIDSQVLQNSSNARFLGITALILFLCVLLGWKLVDRPDLSQRLTFLATGVFVASAALLAVTFLQKGRGPEGVAAAPGKKQNAILIVIDGLSTKNLSTYNPEAHSPFFDEIAAQSVVYTNIRSNFAFTSGFFYSLYSGRKDWIDHSRDKGKGLLAVLQDAGVNTRWLVFNNNGVPDSHNFPHDFPYKGLRSAFLTAGTAWLPRLVGMDYNIFLLSGAPSSRGKPMGPREDALYRQMAKLSGDSYLSPLENIAIDEIEALREDERPYFLIIHLPPNALTFFTQDQRLWQFGEHNIWAFEPDDLKQNFDLHLQEGTRSLLKFFNTLSEKGWDRDTLAMVTSDHGRIFEKKKINYVWYNDEAVARVPFLLRSNQRTGRDDRLGETIDITETVLEHFGVDHRFSPRAVSLLSNERKTRVTTFAHTNILAREWLLNIYEDGHRYALNLFPAHFKVRKERFTGYYDTELVDEGNHLYLDETLRLADSVKENSIEGDPVTARKIQDLISADDVVSPF